MKKKAFIAFILLQCYLVAAFGVSLHEQFCCDSQTTAPEAMECHVDETEKNELDCFLCDDHQAPIESETCCEDCAELTIQMAPDDRTQTATVKAKQTNQADEFQPIVLELYGFQPTPTWRVNYTNLPPSTQSTLPVKSSLYIHHCTYRL
jgi:hypothetical protein